MNIHQHNAFARFDGLDAMAGYGEPAEMAGLGKKLKKLKKKVSKAVGKVAKIIPGAALLAPNKKNLKNAAKGMAVGAAIGAAVIGGPKAISAAMKISKAVKAKKQQKQAMQTAEADIESQAAQYEAELERQDAAAVMAPQWSSQGSTGGASAAARPQGTDSTTAAPEKNKWILPAVGIGAALLTLV